MKSLAIHKNLVKTNELINVKVINVNRENLGKVYEVVINKLSGQVEYIVLESNSFLGLNGKFFAIPWHAIHYDVNEEAFVLNAKRKAIENAKGFDKNDWSQFYDLDWAKHVSDLSIEAKAC